MSPEDFIGKPAIFAGFYQSHNESGVVQQLRDDFPWVNEDKIAALVKARVDWSGDWRVDRWDKKNRQVLVDTEMVQLFVGKYQGYDWEGPDRVRRNDWLPPSLGFSKREGIDLYSWKEVFCRYHGPGGNKGLYLFAADEFGFPCSACRKKPERARKRGYCDRCYDMLPENLWERGLPRLVKELKRAARD